MEIKDCKTEMVQELSRSARHLETSGRQASTGQRMAIPERTFILCVTANIAIWAALSQIGEMHAARGVLLLVLLYVFIIVH